MGFRYKLSFDEKTKTLLIGLAKIQTLLLGILMFFETWKMLTGIYGGMPNRAEVAEHIIHSGSFMYGEVLFGMLIPFVAMLLTKWRSVTLYFFTSLIGMIGIFFMRFDLVEDTQLKPLQMMKITEYQLAPKWIEYFPSTTEIMISLGGLGLCIALYYVGTRVFNLDEDTHH
jgi:molybdopterin-containing oxidoreductase family membrane subunit